MRPAALCTKLVIGFAFVTAAPTLGAQTQHADTNGARGGWLPEPNGSQLMLMPTGRVLPDGVTTFGDTYLLLLHVDHGFGGRFSFGGGTSVFPTTNFSDNVFFLTPKLGIIQKPEYNVSVGALVGFAGQSRGSAGALYVSATDGGPDANVTYGAGWLYVRDKVQSQPAFVLGGLKRMSKGSAFITENYATVGKTNGALVSYGVRLFGESLSVDLAFTNVITSGATWYFPGIPYVAFSVKF